MTYTGHKYLQVSGILGATFYCRELVSGQWSVVSGQWSVVSGQWSVVSGQWSVVILSHSPTLPLLTFDF
ncbi:hypothetical protein [Argonema antarcticum]|uniref:hypothetical protein n=1 Tax=Argonema antarcticum TaxID=2942763 RepID=UPI002012E824|nr:hypothetical protein [Argonema antarcticum]MCL1471493.1 hypothetical protein [Argonema antarcticum A004/B2]